MTPDLILRLAIAGAAGTGWGLCFGTGSLGKAMPFVAVTYFIK